MKGIIEKKNTFTYREILSQPMLWKVEFDELKDMKLYLKGFFERNGITKKTRVVFAGAGTSAFIGDALAVFYKRMGYCNIDSISTTDIISAPDVYFQDDNSVVLVSFARSGNSPESLAVVEFVNSICGDKVTHIIITCNKDGDLSRGIRENDLLLLLPPDTNDKGLAMTSSFSTMLLTGFMIGDIESIESYETSMEMLVDDASRILVDVENAFSDIAKLDFERAVFLGSSELKGIAEECHLKLQELTDGKVLCKCDSFLGFRHGPKAVLNEKTLIVYLFSNEDYAFLYEKDLVQQINSKNKLVAQISVSQRKVEIEGVDFDKEIVLGENVLSFMCYVFVGQMIGYFKSLDLSLNPDSPAVSGNIARVVEGVTIYPYPKLIK